MSESGVKEVGQAIRAIREQLGWTQKTFAEHVGTTQAQISDIERGTGNPTVDMLHRISDVFGVPVFTLFGAGAAIAGVATFAPFMILGGMAAMAGGSALSAAVVGKAIAEMSRKQLPKKDEKGTS